MIRQLRGLTEEEESIRVHFNVEHGAHLPEDLCLCIGDKPTKWHIQPLGNEAVEVLPDIDNELLLKAKTKLDLAETTLGAELSI
jgi:autophagy-related protein 17